MTTEAAVLPADLPEAPADTRQPRVLYMLFFTEMWERFSYYGMRALLVLYMVKALHFQTASASTIYGLYTGFVYLTPLIGGLMADRVLGYRYAIILGGVLMAIGHFLMAFTALPFFFSALLFLIIGNGFFKPNISTLVGTLYTKNDPRRDGGFTIFYMGINLGAFFSPIICGQWLGENPSYGFHWGFAAAGVGMVIGLCVFLVGQRWLGTAGYPPRHTESIAPGDPSAAGYRAAPQVKTVDENAAPLTDVEKGRVWAIIIVGAFVIFFWMAFEQAGNTMTLWADDYTDRTIFGWTVKASLFQAINPLFIFMFAPVFAKGWVWLAKIGKEPSTPFKMVMGLAFVGIGFVLLVIAAMVAGEHGKSGAMFLVGTYFLHTVGELCLSPVGLSFVTKLAPKKLAGLLMGAWFGAIFAGNLLAGLVGALWQKMSHVTFFSVFVVSSLIAAGILYMMMPKVKALMAGVH